MTCSDLIVAFTVFGEPKPKERPRFGKGRAFTSPKTVAAENAIIGAFDLACPLWVPVTDEIRLEVEFHRKGLRVADLDNLVKTAQDALNGVLYADDAQITDLHAWRFHEAGDKARTEIRAYYADDKPGVNEPRNEKTERKKRMPIKEIGQDLVDAIHAWCPVCAGAGVVMSPAGRDDCPNAGAHSYLAQLAGD